VEINSVTLPNGPVSSQLLQLLLFHLSYYGENIQFALKLAVI